MMPRNVSKDMAGMRNNLNLDCNLMFAQVVSLVEFKAFQEFQPESQATEISKSR